MYCLLSLADEVDVLDASRFGEPSGPILIDRVKCSGDESSLSNCVMSEIPMCTQSQDVGIICHGRKHAGNLPSNATFLPLHSADDDCLVNNAGCDHVCTETIRSYSCSCFPGYTLETDGHTCIGVLLYLCF